MKQIQNYTSTVIVITFTILAFCLTACQDIGDADPKTRRKGSTVLRDYVKKPLDKAEGVNKLNDARNKRMEDSIKELDGY